MNTGNGKKPPDASQAVLHCGTDSTCPPSRHVAALVITYFPDYRKLACLLDALRETVPRILVFNNGSDIAAHRIFMQAYADDPVYTFYEATHNLGVAKALNQGIRYLEELGYSYCWTFDQDSLPEKDAYRHLMDAISTENNSTLSIAAVVPSVFNRCESAPVPFLVHQNDGQVAAKIVENTGEVIAGITSGMLVNISIWQNLGGACEGFFIDHVDTEWCFRAKAKGFRIVAVPKAKLQHELGSPSGGKSYLRSGRPLALRPPIRTYYMLRNGWAISRMSYAPKGWYRYNNIQALKIILVAVFYGPSRMEQIAAIFRARRSIDEVLI